MAKKRVLYLERGKAKAIDTDTYIIFSDSRAVVTTLLGQMVIIPTDDILLIEDVVL